MTEKNYIEETSNKVIQNMINNNDIRELLEFKIEGNKIKYRTDGKMSLKESLSGVISVDDFLNIFMKIVHNVNNLESYMILENNLYLNIDDIYMDINGEVYFKINISEDIENSLKMLYHSLLNTICLKIENNADKILIINNYFNTSSYKISELISLINNLNEKSAKSRDEELIDRVKEETKQMKNLRKENKKSIFNIKCLFKKKDKHIVENDLDTIFKLNEKTKDFM